MKPPRVAPLVTLLVALSALLPTRASTQRATEAPPLAALIERISQALGGSDGGVRALERVSSFDFAFRRTVRESHSAIELTAEHWLVSADGGARRRLDIRMVQGEGRDSATVLDGDAAWLVVDGERYPVDPNAVRARFTEFEPHSLFSVPLALASEGRQILGDAALSVVGRTDEGGRSRFVLVGTAADGSEAARIEVDAKTYYPMTVAFRSPGGHIVYRYDDYRTVGPGIVVPFQREFLRNGVRISRTEVFRFRLELPAGENLFDLSGTDLPQLGPKDGFKRGGG